MIQYVEQLYAELETRLSQIVRPRLSLQQVQDCFDICHNAVMALTDITKEKGFASREDEITFFRIIRPKFTSLQRYYILLYNHLLFKPDEYVECAQYLERNLERLTRFFTKPGWFYDYYQSGSDHLDQQYFTRPDETYSSAPGEMMVSDLMAQQLLAEYIRGELKEMGCK